MPIHRDARERLEGRPCSTSILVKKFVLNKLVGDRRSGLVIVHANIRRKPLPPIQSARKENVMIAVPLVEPDHGGPVLLVKGYSRSKEASRARSIVDPNTGSECTTCICAPHRVDIRPALSIIRPDRHHHATMTNRQPALPGRKGSSLNAASRIIRDPQAFVSCAEEGDPTCHTNGSAHEPHHRKKPEESEPSSSHQPGRLPS